MKRKIEMIIKIAYSFLSLSIRIIYFEFIYPG